jgi:hypothetical protein
MSKEEKVIYGALKIIKREIEKAKIKRQKADSENSLEDYIYYQATIHALSNAKSIMHGLMNIHYVPFEMDLKGK